MLVIGITGGVGAGKSSVLKALEEHCNCKMVLADDVGNKVKEPGQKCYSQIVDLLGNEILNDMDISHKTLNFSVIVDKDSEDCWLFVKIENNLGDAVTINGLTGWTAVPGHDGYYQYNATGRKIEYHV